MADEPSRTDTVGKTRILVTLFCPKDGPFNFYIEDGSLIDAIKCPTCKRTIAFVSVV